MYLGDINDFLLVGIFLHTVPGQELPVMTRQQAPMQAPAFSTPLGGASNSTQNNGHQLHTPEMSPALDDMPESESKAGSNKSPPRGAPKARASTKAKARASAPSKRSHQKAPKDGIPRPPNYWICFRRHFDPIIRRQHPGINNGTVCKFTRSPRGFMLTMHS